VYVAGNDNEWQRAFEMQRNSGRLLLVKKEGEVFKPLDCNLSGKYVYSEQPHRRFECATNDTKTLTLLLPTWFRELSESLSVGMVADYEGEVVGRWSLEKSNSICRNELSACSEASHVVESIEVGAYASFVAPREWYTKDKNVTVLFEQEAARTAMASKVQGLSQVGTVSACASKASSTAEPPVDCSAPVIVNLAPVETLNTMVQKKETEKRALELSPVTPNVVTFGVNGEEELGRLNLVKMCDPKIVNCVTPTISRASELPAGTLFASTANDFRCGGSFVVEGEYWVEANTFREPGLKLCAMASGSTNPEYCADIVDIRQTNVNRKSNWRKDAWPRFRAEATVPTSGKYAAAVILYDAGNFGTYLRNVTFSAR
jgi:hypothetical protein